MVQNTNYPCRICHRYFPIDFLNQFSVCLSCEKDYKGGSKIKIIG